MILSSIAHEGNTALDLLGLPIMLCLYLLPSFIAAFRNKRKWTAIFLFNLLLGWTFCGWIFALDWSTRADATIKNNTI
jgi:hypothetical protein